jgi:hypothetical protein
MIGEQDASRATGEKWNRNERGGETHARGCCNSRAQSARRLRRARDKINTEARRRGETL